MEDEIESIWERTVELRDRRVHHVRPDSFDRKGNPRTAGVLLGILIVAGCTRPASVQKKGNVYLCIKAAKVNCHTHKSANW
jgi:hypothetical protein